MDPESKELASEGVFRVAGIFELRLQSLAICDFKVAAIRVTKCWTNMAQNGQNDHFGQNSSKNKLPFMILNPPEQTAEK